MKSFLALSFLSSLYMHFFTVPPMYFLLYPWYILYGAPVFLRYPWYILYGTPAVFFTVPLIYFLRYPWCIFYGTPDVFFTVPLMYCSELLCNDACANFTLTFFLLSATLHSEAKANSCKTKLKSGFKDLVKLNLSLVLKIL